MIVLRNLSFSLVYYPTIIQEHFGRRYEVMKHFLKGLAAMAIVLVISMAIHIFCNINGINLDNPIMTTMLSAGFAVLIYHELIKNEKDKES